jgi:hypothetical protein
VFTSLVFEKDVKYLICDSDKSFSEKNNHLQLSELHSLASGFTAIPSASKCGGIIFAPVGG